MFATTYNNAAGTPGAGRTARVVLIIDTRGDGPGLPLHLLRS